jgi:hypothetical protein
VPLHFPEGNVTRLKSVNPASTAHEFFITLFLRKFLGFCHEKRTAHRYMVNPLLLKPLKQCSSMPLRLRLS